MLEVNGRVAVKFLVDEKLFKEVPVKALNQSLLEGNAIINNGDNYLPGDWNEGIIKDDLGFSLVKMPIRGKQE